MILKYPINTVWILFSVLFKAAGTRLSLATCSRICRWSLCFCNVNCYTRDLKSFLYIVKMESVFLEVE